MPQHATSTSFTSGHKRSPESIEKQRETLRRRYAAGELKGPASGTTWTEEQRRKHAKTKRDRVLGNRYIADRGVRQDGSRIRYWMVMTEKGRPRYEHRVIMEAILGRKLERWEHVHHKDHDGLNNNPTNLELLTAPEHNHQHIEDGREWPPARKPMERWSRKFDNCIQCKRTDSPHATHGVCHRCNERNRRALSPQPGNPRPST